MEVKKRKGIRALLRLVNGNGADERGTGEGTCRRMSQVLCARYWGVS